MKSPIELAETLARALDADDYTAAASTMAEDVEYTIGDESFRGPDAVVASYRAASDMAHRLFDQVRYDHQVMTTADRNVFRISYSDELTVGDETLGHKAEQHVTVTPGVGVIRIVNVDVAGEKEKVDAFMERHGLSRD